jgi:Flp pilus assembly pilin Flp
MDAKVCMDALRGAFVRLQCRAAADERGQTTAEYALVLLVAGLIVGIFAAFVRSGSLTDMFHTIVSGLIHRVLG